MKGVRVVSAFTCCLLLAMSFFPAEVSAQSPETTHLLELLGAEDLDSVGDELFTAAVDAGPRAIPALQNRLNTSKNRDQRLVTLGCIAYIGGNSAVTILRQEYNQRIAEKKENLGPLLALVLGSVDTADTRKQLIEMLAPDRYDENTVGLAVTSLALLRAKEAIPALRALQNRTTSVDSETIRFALNSIERGDAKVAMTPSDERGRAIAAMLRNGVPNLAQDDVVLDEDGFWVYRPLGWVRMSGKPTGGTTDGPSVTVHIGAEGSRALILLDGIRCGSRCQSGYHIVLRKEGAGWKVQLLTLAWVT